MQAAASTAPASAKTLSLPFSANTVAGDLILVGFGFDTSATSSSVTDSQGNTFTQVGTQLTTPGDARSVVYFAKNIKGGADTVTVSLSANSAYIELYLAEYSGIDQTNPIDAQAGFSGSAGTVSSGNATTAHAGDVIYGFCEADWACTAGSGFAARSTYVDNLTEDKTAGSPGSYAATGSADNGWTMQMVALKPALAPVITSATTASGTAGSAFSYQITTANSPTSYGATGLPAGLTVNSGTGLISGKPTAAGTSTATLSATNIAGTGSAKLTLTIALPAPVITSATTASGAVGSAFSYQITAANSPTSYGATGLPAGLTVNSGTGLISGKPTAAGTSTVTLSATNSTGAGTARLTIAAVEPVLSIDATTVAFGNVVLNTTATQTVTLTSTGTSPVTVSGLMVKTGIGYTLSGPALPVTLSTGQQANLEVEFDPTVTGPATGQLTITSTSSSNGTSVITLTGTGVSPSYAVDVSWDAPSSSTDPVAGYNILRSLSGTSTYQLINSSVDTQTTYTDTTVQAGQTYDYVIESVDSSGNASVPSSPIAVTIP